MTTEDEKTQAALERMRAAAGHRGHRGPETPIISDAVPNQDEQQRARDISNQWRGAQGQKPIEPQPDDAA